MANGPSGPSPPWQPNGWVKLVTQLGLPTVILGILLWFVLVRMMAAFDKITAEMDAQTAALQRLEARHHHGPPPPP